MDTWRADPQNKITLESTLDDLLVLLAERNPDFYEYDNGALTKTT